jgi:hypothetical protein
VLAKAVAARLRGVLDALWKVGWGQELSGCRQELDRLLEASPLGEVADEPITGAHEQAALGARHPAYLLSARLHRALREALDEADPAVIARVLAEGALAPLSAPTRFELAVLIRLIEAIEGRLAERAPARWALQRTAVLAGRRDVADFAGARGEHLRIYYNQACLAPGPHDAGVRRYFGHAGRLRPDITVIVNRPGREARAIVLEAKLSADPGYLVQGYREALLYRLEYAAQLRGWPKAILVTSAAVAEPPRREEEVIAVGWDRWVPEEVVEGMIEGFLDTPTQIAHARPRGDDG